MICVLFQCSTRKVVREVEISTIEDILEISKEYNGEDIIVCPATSLHSIDDNKPTLMIYDTYIE
jgi:SepF-like predicted cell division protein (DUF552 family)